MPDPDFDRLPGKVVKITEKTWLSTIVEIAVVVCVIAVLVALLMPALESNHGFEALKNTASGRANPAGKPGPR